MTGDRYTGGPRTGDRLPRRRRTGPAVSISHVARANALIELGSLEEAHAPLDQVDLMMLPESDRTFLMVAWRTIRSRLALAEGDVDGVGRSPRRSSAIFGRRAWSCSRPRRPRPRASAYRGGTERRREHRARGGDRARGTSRRAQGALGSAGHLGRARDTCDHASHVTE